MIALLLEVATNLLKAFLVHVECFKLSNFKKLYSSSEQRNEGNYSIKWNQQQVSI